MVGNDLKNNAWYWARSTLSWDFPCKLGITGRTPHLTFLTPFLKAFCSVIPSLQPEITQFSYETFRCVHICNAVHVHDCSSQFSILQCAIISPSLFNPHGKKRYNCEIIFYPDAKYINFHNKNCNDGTKLKIYFWSLQSYSSHKYHLTPPPSITIIFKLSSTLNVCNNLFILVINCKNCPIFINMSYMFCLFFIQVLDN